MKNPFSRLIRRRSSQEETSSPQPMSSQSMPKMQVLSYQDIQELDADLRYVCSLIREVNDEDRTVDQSRTRFLRYDFPKYVIGKIFRPKFFIGETFVYEIRRNDSSKLDLDVLFCDLDPALAAGPPFDGPPEPGHISYQLWEPSLCDDLGDPDLKKHFDQLRPFLRDWLSGRLTVTTIYVDDVPYRLILKRGDEVIGERPDRRIRLFDKRREVTRHT